jgi:hypothetical protein
VRPPAFLLALAIGCGPAEHTAVDAGVDVGVGDRFAECARCHASEARDHAASMHARAFDDPLFTREWSTRRSPWCVECHAPLARDEGDPRVHEGIGCASCHVIDGAITNAVASGRAPHETRLDGDFSSADRCAGCHEFDFRARVGHRTPERLQRTLTEWRQTGRSESCVDCHMPEGSHRLRGPRDPELLARALDVEVSASRRGRSVVVRASLRVAGAGHAVPTGDLFRNLVFRATTPHGTAFAELARVFDRNEDGDRIEIADQRVLPGVERRLTLELPAGRMVRWSLTWNALAPDATRTEDIDESLRTRLMASGELRVR